MHEEPTRRNRSLPDFEALVGGVRGVPAADAERPLGDRWGRDPELVERLAPFVDFLYDRWFRTEADGFENIPEGGALLVANHAGAFPPDAPQIQWAVRRHLERDVYMMGENLLSRVPFLGWVFRRAGGIEANPETARKLLADDGCLALVFPEGTKGTGKHMSQRYRLQRFGRGGFVRVAMDAGVPIVPVVVLGAEEAMPVFGNLDFVARLANLPYVPLTSLIWLPVKFRIKFLPPIHVADGPTDDHTVALYTEGIRDAIQTALLDLIGARKSVVLG
ncbi:MAG: acyltransferase family protein [Acidimicrobiia bacterium]|nr:acyltransferase family protein [Acidimicrobiia bacterium]